MRVIGLGVISILFLGGCAIPVVQVDTEPLEEVLGTAAPVAWAATMTWAELQGLAVPCGNVASGTGDVRDPMEMSFDVGPQCPLPISEEGDGLLITGGMWASPDMALMMASFTNIEVGDHTLVVWDVATMSVTPTQDGLLVTYAEQDVRTSRTPVRSSAGVGQTVWTVFVDLAGTPADPSDDTLTIHGARQGAEAGDDPAAGAEQVALADVIMEPRCRRNPVSGLAVVEQAWAGAHDGHATTATLLFHELCDGRADVVAAIGDAIPAIGTSVELDLLD